MKTHDPNSTREQRLLFLLPAAAVLVVYAFLIALPKQRQLAELMDAHHATKTRAVDKLTADQSRQNLAVAQDGLARLRKRLSSDRLNMKEISQQWRSPEEQLQTIQQLTEMLDEYQLSMLNQTQETEPNISSYFQTLTEKINTESPSATPIEFWKIEIEGSYSDMQNFLYAIDLKKIKTFPITLSMNTENEGNAPKWTIIFVV